MKRKEPITVHVKMDEKTYKRFSYFDAFNLRKRWRSPVIFAGLMLAFGIIALLLRMQGSLLIGAVLIMIGLGLPVIWFASYISSVRLKAVQLQLEKPRPVYTVTIGQALRVRNDQKEEPIQELAWEKVFGAWRHKDAVYLYATPAKAFILPDGQADASPQQLWRTLGEVLGQDKLHESKK